MFAMIFAATAMKCCVLIQGGRSEELSKTALDLVNVLSGYFDNQEQINSTFNDYSFIQIWVIPVHVPVFRSNPAFLFTEAKDGTVIRIQLHVVSSVEGDVIRSMPYNFTDPSLYKQGEFPLKALDNLTLDQFHTDPDCLTTYERMFPDVFTGKYPFCELTVNGTHPVYVLIYTCDEKCAATPKTALEGHGLGIYDMKRKGDKYKMPYAPDNYVGPCDKNPARETCA